MRAHTRTQAECTSSFHQHLLGLQLQRRQSYCPQQELNIAGPKISHCINRQIQGKTMEKVKDQHAYNPASVPYLPPSDVLFTYHTYLCVLSIYHTNQSLVS